MNPVITTVLALLGTFFKNNATIEEVEVILPSVITAITSAKAGQAFSVNIPVKIDNVSGEVTFGWTPSQANPAG